MGKCPNCDWFETGHSYHCKKCGQGFPDPSSMASHAQTHIDRVSAEAKRRLTNLKKKNKGDPYVVF